MLVPALLLPLVAIVAANVLPAAYSTSATLWVDVATDETASPNTKLSTASAEEANAFGDWLETLSFRKQVVTDAGLAPLVEALQWPEPSAPGSWFTSLGMAPLAQRLGGTQPGSVEEAWKRATDYVLKTIDVRDKGNNLITVTYTGPDKVNAQKLVQAATSNFLREKANAAQRKVEESNRVHDPIIAELETEVEDARKAYASYSASLPASHSVTQEQELQDLEAAYKDASSRLEELKLNRASATLSTLTDWTNKSPNVTLVDAPDAPKGTQGVIALAKLSLLAGVLGCCVGGVLIVFRTWLDRELRIPEDVEARLGRPVIAVLPLIGEPGTGVSRGR
jgi:uncharacterized protein involved in exopolysaccharide biosynthesis